MRWCPHCQTEYVNNAVTCNDCQRELKEGPMPERDDQPRALKLLDTEFLTTVSDEIEANMLQELLQSNGIQTMIKHREAGEFFTVSFGIDLYVNKEKLDTARALLQDLQEEPEQTVDELPQESEGGDQKSSLLQKSLIITIVLVICIGTGIQIFLQL